MIPKKKFEYKVIDLIPNRASQVEVILTREGELGWELVSVVENHKTLSLYFKREEVPSEIN